MILKTRLIMNEIISEEPKDHWYFLNVKDKMVLDLGCGLWDGMTPTPVYFLEQGARRVVGVDGSTDSFNWYYNNFRHHKFFMNLGYIDNVEHFRMYISFFKPQVIKIDVEGAELFMAGLTEEDMAGVEELAIEYHGLAHNILIQGLAKQWGLTERTQYRFTNIEVDGQGVWYFTRPK